MKSLKLWQVPGRIAYIVNHSYPYSTNGYAVRTHGVAKALVELGHSVLVITRPGYPRDLPGMQDSGKNFSQTLDGVRYFFLDEPARVNGSNETWFEGAATSLEEMFRIFKPSVVMAASNWENAIPAQRAAERLGLPFAYEVRGFWEISRASREPGFEHSAEFAHVVKQETAIARSASTVVTINRLMQDELKRRGVDPGKLCLLPNGIDDLPPLHRDTTRGKEALGIRSEFVIGYIGSFTEYEGIEDLIAATAALVAANIDVSLLLVGSSNPVGLTDAHCTLSTAYRKLAEELGIGERLFLTGRQSREMVGEYYRMIDTVVIPRRPYQVSQLVAPIKPVEAAAWGKCVLMSDVGALADLRSQVPGFAYFKAGDSADLTRALRKLLPDTERRTAIAAANRASAENLTWKANATELSARLFPKKVTVATEPVVQRPASLKLVQEREEGDLIRLSNEPVWFGFELDDTDFVTLYGTLDYELESPQSNGKALLIAEYVDKDGNLISGPYSMFRKSDTVGWFTYLKPMARAELVALRPPAGTRTVRIGLRTFHSGSTLVSIANEVRLIWHDNQVHALPVAAARKILALPFENSEPKRLPRLKVASIFDPFSHACFAPECDLISITPGGWREQLLGQKIDMILVESAWHGNNDTWLYRIASYRSPPGNELKDILQWARKFGIPTVFWNKEDPPNFDRFIDRAVDFDYIFTTDENCIERYRKRVPASTYIGALPFAAQTDIHNPYLDVPRLDATSFAGTYYADDFEARRNAMDMLLRTASQYGLDIFDRMFNVSGEEKKRFLFPSDLQKYIRGSLNYTEMLAAYRRYRVALNVNSVADSPTMFSRRVFELLACGTPVVSTASQGIDAMFNGLVPTVDTQEEAQHALASLMTSGIEWQRSSVRGIRTVFDRHTYKHRLDQMAKVVGLEVQGMHRQAVIVVIPDGNPEALAKCLAEQRVRPAEIILARTTSMPQFVSAHRAALTAAGLRVIDLPKDNIASYIRSRHANAVVALCSSKHYYGPQYLTDAMYAVEHGSPVVSSILPQKDVLAHFTSSRFEPFAKVGTTSNVAFAGSIVVSAASPTLNKALSLTDDGLHQVEFAVRERAWFEFLAHAASERIANNLVNLD